MFCYSAINRFQNKKIEKFYENSVAPHEMSFCWFIHSVGMLMILIRYILYFLQHCERGHDRLRCRTELGDYQLTSLNREENAMYELTIKAMEGSESCVLSKRHHIDITCVNLTSDWLQIDAHDVVLMLIGVSRIMDQPHSPIMYAVRSFPYYICV